uniref:PIN domain-containing protein n=1 Tax=Methanococcus maripaludis (strain C6 / ATCC BAA-1332) TaxID=444158 RepID=A9A6W1_METM6
MRTLKESQHSKCKKSNCTVDTNIIIGVFNETDSFHNDCTNLLINLKRLYVPFSACSEASKTFSNKVYQALGPIIRFYAFENLKLDHYELCEKENKLLEELDELFPHNQNFNKFAIRHAREIRQKYYKNNEVVRELTNFAKNLANRNTFLNIFDKKIKDINSEILYKEYIPDLSDKKHNKKYMAINECLNAVVFKDPPDKKIFIHTIHSYPHEFELPVYGISTDNEYVEKSNVSKVLLEKELNYDLSSIEFIKLEDFLNELEVDSTET